MFPYKTYTLALVQYNTPALWSFSEDLQRLTVTELSHARKGLNHTWLREKFDLKDHNGEKFHLKDH